MTKEILVIVESPAKAKTIKKYLGSRFEVAASMGHIADLPKGNNVIDVTNKFAVTYEVSSDKKSIVSQLRKASKSMQVRIATDEDREGEAIGWHLCQQLKLDPATTPRIVFREITKSAISKAAEKPGRLDLDLVNAQQARRILDRLVGFDLSPVLRKKIKAGLSAGRVQSVAVKILVQREQEIQVFEEQFDFKLKGVFVTNDRSEITAEYSLRPETAANVRAMYQLWPSQTNWTVSDIKQTPGTKNPSTPFTTSTLQQEASRKMGLPVARTMQIAQRLYEAGHITYMRTDSPILSQQARNAAERHIKSAYGDEYHQHRNFKPKKDNAQEAHEAIRPTQLNVQRAGADEQQKKLYHLIWQRTIASQMAPAKTQKTTITIQSSQKDSGSFVAKGEVIAFDGFLKVYGSSKETYLPQVSIGEHLLCKHIHATQTFAKPPARYTEASLVKKLEDLGIGRPSTYAPTIATIQKRGYVDKGLSEGTPRDHQVIVWEDNAISESVLSQKTGSTKGKLVPTDVGMVVTEFLDEHFETIMDYRFTANVEEQFDQIAAGKKIRYEMLKEFYTPFHKRVEEVVDTAERANGERVLGSHPESGKIVKVRIGRYGPLVQVGEQGDEEVEYASLPQGMHINTVTLEEALTGFDMPRKLGERDGKMIKANIGRFGPYVQRDKTFASVKQPDDVYSIEYDRAVELIQEKIQKDIENTLRTMTIAGKDITIKKGRRGPFFMRGRKKISLKGEIMEMSESDVEQIIIEKGGKIPKKKTVKKKTTTKKTAAKKRTPMKKATKK